MSREQAPNARRTRRAFLGAVPALVGAATLRSGASPRTSPLLPTGQAELGLRITGMETFVVRATARTNWIVIRLTTNDGATGLGEASLGRRTELPELERFFALVRDRSPFEIHRYREGGRDAAAAGDRAVATAFSAVEQAQWDLVGKALGAPVYDLTGGSLRRELPAYANINRATSDRTPEGFAANARQAVDDGFRAIKAAPFDGFPPLDAPAAEVEAATELGNRVHRGDARRHRPRRRAEDRRPQLLRRTAGHRRSPPGSSRSRCRGTRSRCRRRIWRARGRSGRASDRRWRAGSSSSGLRASSRSAASGRSTSSCRT